MIIAVERNGEKMAGFNTKNKNNHGEYEITFYTDDENEYRYIQQCCRNVIDHAIEPERKKGWWIEHNPHKWGLGIVFECSECGEKIDCEPSNFCPNCGADMRIPVEIARSIVHKVIDNSVWSDTVDTAKMHKVVDDKYAEIMGDANVDAES